MGNWYELKDRKVTVSEKSPSATLRFLVTSTDEEDIDNDIRNTANAPATFLGLSKLGYDTEPQGNEIYFVNVNYGVPTAEEPAIGETPLDQQTPPEPQPPLDGMGDEGNPPSEESLPSQSTDDNAALGPEVSIDTTGGTVHITQSLETVEGYGFGGITLSANPNAVANYEQAIGVTRDGSGGHTIEGVDIGFGKLRFSYTASFRFITRNYLFVLRDLTYSTNSAEYFGFEIGEVLFTGASGTYQGGEAPWKFTFNFEVSPNQTNIVLFGDLAIPALSLIVAEKKGHDYLWVTYEDIVGTDEIAPRAKFAYVERVYDSRNLKQLGI